MSTLDVWAMLKRDLVRLHMTQRALVDMLTTEGGKPMTEQGLSSWKRTGKVPMSRRKRLIKVLGPDSEVAKYYASNSATASDVETEPRSVRSTANRMAQLRPLHQATLEALRNLLVAEKLPDAECALLLSKWIKDLGASRSDSITA